MRIGSLLVALVFAACSPQEEQGGTSGSSEAEIMAASRAFSDAYVRGDTAAIRELYTEDAVLLPPGREVRGNSKIAQYFSPRPNRINVSHAMSSSDLKVVGDLAVDIGMWSNTWRTGDAEEQSASERYLVVWRCGADGRWRIEYDMWHRPSR
jgi:uncharacterized protein (TIGR02246 family)